MKNLIAVIIIYLCPFICNAEVIRIPQDFPTIQEGIDSAAVGDTVLVAPGTYTDTHEDFRNGFPIDVCVSMRSGVVVMSETGPDFTTITNDTASVIILVQNVPDTATVIKGFTIEFSEFWGILCLENASPLIEYNIIKPRPNVEGIGVVFSGTSHGWLRSNDIQGSLGVLVEGASSPAILNNVIKFCEKGALNEDGSSSVISGNLFRDNETGVSITDGKTQLVRNVFLQNQYAVQAHSQTILLNNTMYGDSIGFWALGDSHQIYNTIIWNNNIPVDTSFFFGTLVVNYSDIQGGWPGVGNIDADPLFQHPDTLNFNLQQNSPCVDAGIDTIFTIQGDTIIISDFQGSKPDMGAIESPWITSIKTNGNEILGHFILYPNYPNPFNPATTISYHIPKRSKVVLKIYNILGQEVATLVNENQMAGSYQIHFDASQFSSGIYFYKIAAGSFSSARKMVVMK